MAGHRYRPDATGGRQVAARRVRPSARPRVLRAAALVALATLTCLILLTVAGFAAGSHPPARPSSGPLQAAPSLTRPLRAAPSVTRPLQAAPSVTRPPQAAPSATRSPFTASPVAAQPVGQQPPPSLDARLGAIAAVVHRSARHPTPQPGPRRYKHRNGNGNN